MAQDKVELLAGSGNFPRTDTDGGSRRRSAVAVAAPDEKLNRGDNVLSSAATRSVAQLAESSKTLAPLLKGVNVELKAIRTELQPNKSILKSLQNIEKQLALASKGAVEKKTAANGGVEDRRLTELAQSMSRSVVITDNIAQNTAYIAHALDQLVSARVMGDRPRDKDSEGPRDAVEERKNKRLSKTFADSLDNSKMAKEMEKGFKKVSAMQALNSFANAGQGGLKGLLDGTLNSLAGIIGQGVKTALCSDLGKLAVAGSIGYILGKIAGALIDARSADVNATRDAANATALKKHERDIAKINELERLAKAQGENIDRQKLIKQVHAVHGYEDHQEYYKLASKNAGDKVNQKTGRGKGVRGALFDDLTKEQQQEYTRLLRYRGLITAQVDDSALALGIVVPEEIQEAKKYWEGAQGRGAGVAFKKGSKYKFASEVKKDATSQASSLATLEKTLGYTGSGVTSGAQPTHTVLPSSDKLWSPVYNNNSVAKQLDDAMEGIHPGLGGGTTAQIMGVESDGTDPVVRCKTVKDAPPPISDTNPHGWWLDEKDGKFRPSTAIGLGQFTAIAMKDMEGVDPEVKAAAEELFDREKTPYLPNDTDPNRYRNATKYYRAFEKAYKDPEKQIPLFEAHARSKLGAKGLSAIKNLSAEQAKISIIASHKGGGGVLEADGSFDFSKHPDTASYVRKAMSKPFNLPKVFSGDSNVTEGVVGSSGYDYSSDLIAQQIVGGQVSHAVGATAREQSATPSINIGNIDNSQHTTVIQGSGDSNFNDDSGNCRTEFSGW